MVTGTSDTTDEQTTDQLSEQADLTKADDNAVDGDDAVDEAGESEAGGDDPDYVTGRKDPLDHGVKIRGKVKRGTDTRDQDELLLEGRGADAEEAAADFEAALAKAEQNGWTERLRDLQPAAADGGEDDG